jgi:hypothetical protein
LWGENFGGVQRQSAWAEDVTSRVSNSKTTARRFIILQNLAAESRYLR